jgi:threonine dehydratase
MSESMHEAITLADIYAAQKRIRGVAVVTPLLPLRMPGLAHEIYLKDESAQPIGSFKLRGAYNKIAQLDADQLRRGVITYSSGNHAQGVAYAARRLGARAVIVMPENAPQVKREATLALGADVVTVGAASSERRLKAEALEAEFGYAMVPPYDDHDVIAGQATCGVEILEQLPDVDLVLSPVSGGGLLSGVSAAVKLASAALQQRPPQVWGCEPEVAGDASESFYSRQIVEWPAAKTTRTLADGLRTQSLGQRNFEHILRFVDGMITISEDELREALKIILAHTAIVAEPSGAVTLAAALFHRHELPEAHKIVAIVSGGNLDPQLKAELVAETAESTANASAVV